MISKIKAKQSFSHANAYSVCGCHEIYRSNIESGEAENGAVTMGQPVTAAGSQSVQYLQITVPHSTHLQSFINSHLACSSGLP